MRDRRQFIRSVLFGGASSLYAHAIGLTRFHAAAAEIPDVETAGTVVTSAADLQSALNKGITDITLAAAVDSPPGGIYVPRLASGRVLRCSGDGILQRGPNDTDAVIHSGDHSGGSLTLINFRVDGGWRSNPHEPPLEQYRRISNYYFPNYTLLQFEGCVSCYSYQTGIWAPFASTLEVVGCTFFACTRDAVWEPGVRDYTFTDNVVMACGDDSWGTHYAQSDCLPNTRYIYCARNKMYGSNGMKGHGGAEDGTYNGKKSQVVIEDNEMYGCFYGIQFFYDRNNNEPVARPRNVIFRRNKIENCVRSVPWVTEYKIGRPIEFRFPNHPVDSTLQITGNEIIRDLALQGQNIQDYYSWSTGAGRPVNVPGASAFTGYYNKTGFVTEYPIEVGWDGCIITGCKADIVHHNNEWVGPGWTDILT